MAQLSDPTRLDWGQTVLKNKTEFSISLSLQEIELMSEISFKALVHKKEISTTLRYLNELKERHTKVMHISHNELKMADYLTPNGITNSEAKFLFNARTRMLDVRSNFQGSIQTHCVMMPMIPKNIYLCAWNWPWQELQ